MSESNLYTVWLTWTCKRSGACKKHVYVYYLFKGENHTSVPVYQKNFHSLYNQHSRLLILATPFLPTLFYSSPLLPIPLHFYIPPRCFLFLPTTPYSSIFLPALFSIPPHCFLFLPTTPYAVTDLAWQRTAWATLAEGGTHRVAAVARRAAPGRASPTTAATLAPPSGAGCGGGCNGGCDGGGGGGG